MTTTSAKTVIEERLAEWARRHRGNRSAEIKALEERLAQLRGEETTLAMGRSFMDRALRSRLAVDERPGEGPH